MQCVHDQAGSEFRMESIGSALYTSLAFLNHSCDPNTIKYFVGNTVFLVASRPIQQGEEVTDNYGPHFSLSTRISRHNWLKVGFCSFIRLIKTILDTGSIIDLKLI